LFTSKISDAVIEGRHAYERSQIADQKAATDAAESGEKVDYVDTSKYESYEKQEGDFIEPGTEPEPVLEPIAEPEPEPEIQQKKSSPSRQHPPASRWPGCGGRLRPLRP